MKSAVSRAVGAVLLFCLSAASAQASERPVSILARAGGSLAEREADQLRCEALAQRAPQTDLPQGGDLASAMGRGGHAYGRQPVPQVQGTTIGGLMNVVPGAVELERARDLAAEFCLSNLGYAPVSLTPEEADAFRRLHGGRKRSWEEQFLASPDTAARIAALRASPARDLPGYRAEPETLGGIRIDVRSLTATQGVVQRGGVAASGAAARWRTAEIAEPFEARISSGVLTAPAGVVFHQVDFRPQAEPLLRDPAATWCGPLTETNRVGAQATEVWCFTPQPDGYTLFRATGHAWQAGVYNHGPVFVGVREPLVLREREADAMSLAFDIRVSSLTASNVILEGVVRHGDEQVVLWRQQIPMRARATRSLPLWSRRLHLARVENGVTVLLDDTGTGEGPRR